MKYLFCCVLALCCFCAQNPPELQAKIDKLKAERQILKQEIQGLKYEKNNLQPIIDSLAGLRDEVRVLEFKVNGGEIEYVLECELSQDRLNQMSDQSLKDWMNAVTFNLVVDRRSYYHYNRGDELLRKGRKGSATTGSGYSDWLIKVVGKHINKM